MQSLKRLLVILDVNEHDDVVLDFVNRISGVMKPEHIAFVHVAEDLDIPRAIVEKYPGLIPSIDESINQAIEGKLSNYKYISEHPSIKIETLGGVPMDVISKYLREHDMDLLVVARGSDDEKEVDYLQKLIRRSSCSVAVVPPSISDNIKNLLVPMDFSNNSCMALELAAILSSKHKDMHVYGLHIYKLPHGYFKTGLSKEEFIEEMVKNAKQEIGNFIERSGIDQDRFTMQYSMYSKEGIPAMINRFAFSHNIDAIVLGSRGGNTISSFFLGRVTEALINRDQYLPMFVVKNKGESLKIWEAISL